MCNCINIEYQYPVWLNGFIFNVDAIYKIHFRYNLSTPELSSIIPKRVKYNFPYIYPSKKTISHILTVVHLLYLWLHSISHNELTPFFRCPVDLIYQYYYKMDCIDIVWLLPFFLWYTPWQHTFLFGSQQNPLIVRVGCPVPTFFSIHVSITFYSHAQILVIKDVYQSATIPTSKMSVDLLKIYVFLIINWNFPERIAGVGTEEAPVGRVGPHRWEPQGRLQPPTTPRQR